MACHGLTPSFNLCVFQDILTAGENIKAAYDFISILSNIVFVLSKHEHSFWAFYLCFLMDRALSKRA